MTSDERLEHAIINQIEADMNSEDFSSLSHLLSKLIENKKSKGLIIAYLSDSARESWLEQSTIIRY